MKRWIRTLLLGIVLANSQTVIAAERQVNPEKVGQLLCKILSQSDIPAAIGNLGQVKYNGKSNEPEWEVESERFSISYRFSKDEEGPNGFDLLLHAKGGDIFQNEAAAEQWFSRLGTKIVRDKTSSGKDRIRAVALPVEGRKKTYYDWSSEVRTNYFNNLHVSWARADNAKENQRFCLAFPVTNQPDESGRSDQTPADSDSNRPNFENCMREMPSKCMEVCLGKGIPQNICQTQACVPTSQKNKEAWTEACKGQ